MKTKLLSFLAFSLLLIGCSKTGKDSLNITGNIQGLPEGAVIELIPISHFPEKPLASIPVEKGQFQWTDTINEPIAVRISVADGYLDGQNCLILENGELSIKGVAMPDSTRKGLYYLTDMAYDGSVLTDKYQSLIAVKDTLNGMYKDYMTRYEPIMKQVSEARKAGDDAAVESLENSEEYKAFMDEQKEFFETVQSKYQNVILSNKDSFFGPLMMITLMNYLRPEDKETYDQFSEEAKESRYGKMVKEEVDPETAVGKDAAGFTLPNAQGREVDFLEVCAANKLTILDFWASWCAPCRRSMPGLKELYSKYHDKGLEIVGVSIDKEAADWEKALAQLELPWINLRDVDEDVSAEYKVKAVPTLYLIDGNKKIVAIDLHDQALEDFIYQMLN